MNLATEEEVNKTFEHNKDCLYRKVVVVDKYSTENNNN